MTVQRLLRDILDRSDLDIVDTTAFGDIEGWDSMGQLNLVLSVESEFDVELPPEDTAEVKTIGDLVTSIERAQGG